MNIEQEVDTQLRELALTDWNKFKDVTGLNLTAFTICQQREKGKSYRQIAYRMKISASTVLRLCKKCK